MTDFVIDFCWIRDGFGDFIAEEAPITLAQAMDQALHGCFGNPESLGERRIRHIFALRSQAGAQRLESPEFPLAFAFLPQTPQRLFDNCGGPAQIEESFGGPRFQGLRGNGELRRRLRHPVVPGNEMDIAAPFAGVPFLGCIVEEISERLQEERTKTSPRAIGMPEPVPLEHHDEKILGKVLGILRGMTTPADEGKDRAPIQSAKLRERLPRLLIVAAEIGRSKDKTPARGGEVSRGTAAFRGREGVHRRR